MRQKQIKIIVSHMVVHTTAPNVRMLDTFLEVTGLQICNTFKISKPIPVLSNFCSVVYRLQFATAVRWRRHMYTNECVDLTSNASMTSSHMCILQLIKKNIYISHVLRNRFKTLRCFCRPAAWLMTSTSSILRGKSCMSGGYNAWQCLNCQRCTHFRHHQQSLIIRTLHGNHHYISVVYLSYYTQKFIKIQSLFCRFADVFYVFKTASANQCWRLLLFLFPRCNGKVKKNSLPWSHNDTDPHL